MKCLILAAGYATRLYPLTENFPKPLLKVGEKTILDWLIDDVDRAGLIDEYVVISNHKFAPIFEDWAKEIPGQAGNDVGRHARLDRASIKKTNILVANRCCFDYICHQRKELWHRQHLQSGWTRTSRNGSTNSAKTSA